MIPPSNMDYGCWIKLDAPCRTHLGFQMPWVRLTHHPSKSIERRSRQRRDPRLTSPSQRPKGRRKPRRTSGPPDQHLQPEQPRERMCMKSSLRLRNITKRSSASCPRCFGLPVPNMESTPTQWPLMLIQANRCPSNIFCFQRWLWFDGFCKGRNGVPEIRNSQCIFSGWSTSCFSLRTVGDFGKVEVLLRQVAMKPKYDTEGTKIEGDGAKSKLCLSQ